MARRSKKFKIPGLSFSWKRALGVTSAKRKIARATGIPTTRSGRRAKVGRMMGCAMYLYLFLIAVVALSALPFALAEEVNLQTLRNESIQCSIPETWTATESDLGWIALDPDSAYEYNVFSFQPGSAVETIEDLLNEVYLYNGGIAYTTYKDLMIESDVETDSELCVYGETDVIEQAAGQIKHCCYAALKNDTVFCVTVCVAADADVEMELVGIGASLADAEEEPAEAMYIGNKNSKKLHYINCNSVSDMKESNKVEFFSRDEAINAGYEPCKRCKP